MAKKQRPPLSQDEVRHAIRPHLGNEEAAKIERAAFQEAVEQVLKPEPNKRRHGGNGTKRKNRPD